MSGDEGNRSGAGGAFHHHAIHDPCAVIPNQIQTFPQHHPSEVDDGGGSCCGCFGGGQRGHPSHQSGAKVGVGQQERKWKYFPGHNRFYCNGRVMTAPNVKYCTFSFLLITVTYGLFIIFDGPFISQRFSIAIPILSGFLFVIVLVNMVRTTCSDPGILPRASQSEIEFIERSYGTSSSAYRPPPRTKEIIVNGQPVKSKYCFTCKMFRPPRASHCSICDNCVERFDHHCPFLGNCIGRRNYRSFYFFVVSLSFLAMLILAGAVAHLSLESSDRGNFLEALRETPTSAVVILISFFGMWTVIGLAVFHTYLVSIEQTTNEDIKGIFGRPDSKNPYSRGNCCNNCCYVLCGPNPPSLIDPRGFVTSEFLAALPKSKEKDHYVPTPHGNSPTPGNGGSMCTTYNPNSQSQSEIVENSSESTYPYPSATSSSSINPITPVVSIPVQNQPQSSSSLIPMQVLRDSSQIPPVQEDMLGNRDFGIASGSDPANLKQRQMMNNGIRTSSQGVGIPNGGRNNSGTFPLPDNTGFHPHNNPMFMSAPESMSMSPPDQIQQLFLHHSEPSNSSNHHHPRSSSKSSVKSVATSTKSNCSKKRLKSNNAIGSSMTENNLDEIGVVIENPTTTHSSSNLPRNNNKQGKLDKITMINSPLHLDTIS